jgi:hypothetical protein
VSNDRVPGRGGLRLGAEAGRALPQGLAQVWPAAFVCTHTDWGVELARDKACSAQLGRVCCADDTAMLRLGTGRRARAHMALGNRPSASRDVAAVLGMQPSSPDALKLKAELDKDSKVRAKEAVQAQKKAFGSFWGSNKGAQERQAGTSHKHPAPELYLDKVLEAQEMRGQVFCWMRLGVGGRALGQRVVLQLHPKWGPKTVENFRCLCTGEKKGPDASPLTYAGATIHRVCRGFVLQVAAGTRAAGML